MVRVNISIPREDLNKIKFFCKTHDMKISSIMRRGARELIEKNRNNNLISGEKNVR